MNQIYNGNIKKGKVARYFAKNLSNLCILPENSTEGLGSKRKDCWSYVVSAYENTTKNLVVQEKVKLEHSSQIVKVDVEATCWYFNPWHILKVRTELAGPFGTIPQKPWHLGNSTKLDRVIQFNCGKVQTYASYKKNRTWENFNNRGTKMILVSDELWLIANDSKSFTNGSKSIIRNNLGLCKHSKIYFI